MALLKALWRWWKPVAHRIGNVQARLILSIFYFAVLGPFSLAMRLLSDTSRPDTERDRGWVARATASADPFVVARRQY